jgi:hypothetical protein
MRPRKINLGSTKANRVPIRSFASNFRENKHLRAFPVYFPARQLCNFVPGDFAAAPSVLAMDRYSIFRIYRSRLIEDKSTGECRAVRDPRAIRVGWQSVWDVKLSDFNCR